ncbi:MAG TPA: UTP--glucose-1-phosphate uridylyltransferase [Candidatus Paceibacterota bacterium]|nr:UTP--glucose-1-phosphate uridylyltransferase [Candidatus Paceibacterota bacterium]
MAKKVRKAVIPAAGFGTRFLPQTKAMPKEMLPIVDKPVIQYVVEDAIAAGIEDILIVTGSLKRSIEDHFDYSFELETRLEESGKTEQLEEVRKIAGLANFHYLRQKGPLGNATPILNAKDFVGDEPFLVLWGDDFFDATPSRSKQLIDAYEKHGGAAIISSIRADKPEDYERYGFAAGKEQAPGLLKIDRVVEKPGKNGIDSDYAMVSGYLYEPVIFDALEKALEQYELGGAKGEFVYTSALDVLLREHARVYALEIKGRYFDCGNKLEYLKTVVEFGLKHPELNGEFREFLKGLDLA